MERNTFMHPPWQVQKYVHGKCKKTLAQQREARNVFKISFALRQVSQMIFCDKNGKNLMSLVIISSFPH